MSDRSQATCIFRFISFLAKTWGSGDRLVTSEAFDRHFSDTKGDRDSTVDSHDWRPKFVGDIVTQSNGYRHSFSEPIVPGNASKKLKTGIQSTLHSKFNKILRDYSKSSR